MKVKVLLAVVVMMGLTLGISMNSQSSLTEVKDTTLKIKQGSSSRIPEIQKINTCYIEAQTNLLAFFTAKNDAVKQQYKETQRELFTELTEAVATYQESATEDEDLENTKKLSALCDSYSNYFESYLKGNVRVQNVTEAGEKVGILLNDMIVDHAVVAKRQQDVLIRTSNWALHTIKISNIIVVIVSCIMAVYLIFIAVIPLTKVSRQLNRIIEKINRNKFDVNDRIFIGNKDEIGSMVGDINVLIEKMANMVQLISEDSQKLIGSVQVVSGKIAITNSSVSDTSAAMEELAASMEEIASKTAELTANSGQIYAEAEKIADGAKKGSEYAGRLKKEAKQQKKEATQSKDNTKDVMEEIRITLVESIQNSKQVDKIDELTEEILSISGQTNLLALNASIEAARAGEAGKGFSVVADEIRELAETSKATANTIQEISRLVRKAVHSLAADSKKMVDFIEETVLSDYDKFVSIAEHYNSGVNEFDQMLLKFAKMSKNLQHIIQEADDAIQLVATTITESSDAINTVAENASEMVGAMEGVTGEMKVSESVSNTLLSEVNKFMKSERK